MKEKIPKILKFEMTTKEASGTVMKTMAQNPAATVLHLNSWKNKQGNQLNILKHTSNIDAGVMKLKNM